MLKAYTFSVIGDLGIDETMEVCRAQRVASRVAYSKKTGMVHVTIRSETEASAVYYLKQISAVGDFELYSTKRG